MAVSSQNYKAFIWTLSDNSFIIAYALYYV